MIRTLWIASDGFWSRHPALFVGFGIFIGAWIAVCRGSLLPIDGLLLLPLLAAFSPRRLLFVGLLSGISSVSTQLRVRDVQQGVFSGTLVAEVVDRRLTTFHHRPFWHMVLYVHEFSTNNHQYVVRGISVPVTVAPPCPMIGGWVYRLPATISVDEGARIRLRPTLTKCLTTNRSTPSFVEWRVGLRRNLEQVFVRLFSDEAVRHVAGALTFGLYKDPSLQQAMHRAGVEHVLAISGFHFGIVAALTVYCMGVLSTRLRAAVAMVLLTLYLLMVGPLPSVIRAWCSAMVILGGFFLHRTASGLNCLGIGLIVAVLYDPTFVVHIGFQLSFLATAAILFFSQDSSRLLQAIVPLRSMSVLEHFSFMDQILFGVLRWGVPVLSLIIPVTLVIIPYQMAFLQDFSTLGSLYNLLIPMLFSFAMPPILIAVLVCPCPMVASCFATVAEPFLRLGLVLVNNTPETSWALISGGMIHSCVGRLSIATVFLFGMYIEGSRAAQKTEARKACL